MTVWIKDKAAIRREVFMKYSGKPYSISFLQDLSNFILKCVEEEINENYEKKIAELEFRITKIEKATKIQAGDGK